MSFSGWEDKCVTRFDRSHAIFIARGAFAGISLEGSTLRPDEDANRKLYGKSTSAAKIILEAAVPRPDAAHELIAALETSSPKLKR